jgi:nitrate reductase delta subunit
MKSAEIGVCQQLAAQLLRYPAEALDRQLVRIGEVAATLPARLGAPLAALAAHLATLGVHEAGRDYTRIFLAPGSCGLLLSSPDDAAFEAAYRRAGRSPSGTERPDFLPLVLEFAAALVVAGDRSGQHLLHEYRWSLSTIAGRLGELRSPYRLAIEAVSATLPVALPAHQPA